MMSRKVESASRRSKQIQRKKVDGQDVLGHLLRPFGVALVVEGIRGGKC